MIIKLSNIEGMIFGAAIGDSMGVPLSGYSTEADIVDKLGEYPIISFKTPFPFSKFGFMTPGSWSYSFQILLSTFTTIIEFGNMTADSIEILFTKFLENIITGKVNDKHRGNEILYQQLFLKYMMTGKDNMLKEKFNYSGSDYNSNTPLFLMAPAMFLQNNYIASLWVRQKNLLCLTHCSSVTQLYLIYFLKHLIMTKDIKCAIENFYQFLKKWESIKSCSSFKLLFDVMTIICETKTFKEAIIRSINDYPAIANEIGCLTGLISGLINGSKNIPNDWLNGVENIGLLKSVSSNLYNLMRN